ncbi:hypothetical protein FC52_GL001126 [Lactobacillus pasteurii DSM 23907 = CRBIP 24.76]|nr:hypothetical protein FC52_GL001126 [Lactobacillus pasteurii DSM 23907 = CRBIP 24.76]
MQWQNTYYNSQFIIPPYRVYQSKTGCKLALLVFVIDNNLFSLVKRFHKTDNK